MPFSKPNQNCWNCNHFQRDTQDPQATQVPWGDCRRLPEPGERESEGFFLEFHPFILEGVDFWCGFWENALHFVPAEPVNPPPIVWPDDWFNWIPWNVKASQNISCWSCDHFKRYVEDPQTTGDVFGECRKGPPPPTTGFDDNVDPELWWYTNRPRRRGPDMWCGCWQRSIEDVPAIPTDPP